MEIRPCEPRDENAVIDLWSTAGLIRPWNDPVKDIARKATVQPDLFLVADDDGVIAGVVMAGYDGHRGWINYLAVEKSRRGTGIGRELVGRAEAELAALGCPKVNLQIRLDNAGTVALYEHLGYERYEVIDMSKRLVTD